MIGGTTQRERTMTTTIEAPNVERHEMPSGAVVYYRDADHSYWKGYEGGQVSGRIPGISTIAKAGNGDTGSVDGLMGWAIKLYRQGIDFKAKREEAAVVGTRVHKALETLADPHKPLIYTGEPLGHIDAVVDWWHDRHPEPLNAEFFVYHRELSFAGQPDLLYGDRAYSTLLDLKTGSIRPEAFVQLNLYRLAMISGGFPRPSRLLLLDTKDDGTWREVEVPIRPEWAVDAFRVYNNGKEIGKALRAATK
jgi:hypothetical protein